MPMEFVRTYHAQAHEITNAITAVVINAQAGLHLLRAQSPDLEQVRQALKNIASDGKRAGDIVVRSRGPMKKVAAADNARGFHRFRFGFGLWWPSPSCGLSRIEPGLAWW